MAARKEGSRETFLVRRVIDVMRDAGFSVEETRAGLADLSATKADFLGRRHVLIGCYREVRTQKLNGIKARWESQRSSGESSELWIVADAISATARTLWPCLVHRGAHTMRLVA
jgi:hypothetical protein